MGGCGEWVEPDIALTNPVMSPIFPDWLASADVQQIKNFVSSAANNPTVVMGTN